jgi:hypothetical protein
MRYGDQADAWRRVKRGGRTFPVQSRRSRGAVAGGGLKAAIAVQCGRISTVYQKKPKFRLTFFLKLSKLSFHYETGVFSSCQQLIS